MGGRLGFSGLEYAFLDWVIEDCFLNWNGTPPEPRQFNLKEADR